MSTDEKGGWRFSIFTFFDSESFTALGLICLILLAAPLIIVLVFLYKTCLLIVNYALLFVFAIVALATITGLLVYKISKAKYKALGVVASALNVVSGILILLFYSIPYVIEKPGISSSFDFIITVVISFFVKAGIVTFASLKENGIKHLLCVVIAIIITLILLNERLTSPEIIEIYKAHWQY